MIRVEKDNRSGAIQKIEMDEEGLCEFLKITPEELQKWEALFPATNGIWTVPTGETPPRQELQTWKKRVALLRTRMTPKAVRNIESVGLLDSYAELAKDCPEGITAHVWRSYGAIVLMQVRHNQKIGPHELALRANLEKIAPGGKTEPDVDMAAKHIRFLIAQGLLREGEDGLWEHQGLPSFFQS